MVVLANPALEEISLVRTQKPAPYLDILEIDLKDPLAGAALVEACEDLGFFKITNHGIPMELMSRLEAEAVRFFSQPEVEKVRAGPPNPFGYGNKIIGSNGDVGWVEYLLFEITSKPMSRTLLAFLQEPSASLFRCALNEYISATRTLACEVLELMADGLRIQPRNVFSRMLRDEGSDSVFRLNHYPPCPLLRGLNCSLTGFGEHTDPQIISVLRSNNSTGLQISLKDGSWVSVAPDHRSFFVNVGDSLQVLTNGRFKSVRHRVLTNGLRSRVSMIYFVGPPLAERIEPLPQLTEGEQSRYRGFTWAEYKMASHKLRLTENRLTKFVK